MPTLDGRRGIAILAVLCAHSRWVHPAPGRMAVNGSKGFHLFVALSGFLTSTRLIGEYARAGRTHWTNFNLRRVFRISPATFFYPLAAAVYVTKRPCIHFGRRFQRKNKYGASRRAETSAAIAT